MEISQIQSEIKRLNDVIEKQGEEFVELREENKFLRGVCTTHIMSENLNSTALCNVNSSVNSDAETAFIQQLMKRLLKAHCLILVTNWHLKFFLVSGDNEYILGVILSVELLMLKKKRSSVS